MLFITLKQAVQVLYCFVQFAFIFDKIEFSAHHNVYFRLNTGTILYVKRSSLPVGSLIQLQHTNKTVNVRIT